MVFFFFFQAEDGIRDVAVTGVQTCALPICGRRRAWPPHQARQGLRQWTLTRLSTAQLRQSPTACCTWSKERRGTPILQQPPSTPPGGGPRGAGRIRQPRTGEEHPGTPPPP